MSLALSSVKAPNCGSAESRHQCTTAVAKSTAQQNILNNSFNKCGRIAIARIFGRYKGAKVDGWHDSSVYECDGFCSSHQRRRLVLRIRFRGSVWDAYINATTRPLNHSNAGPFGQELRRSNSLRQFCRASQSRQVRQVHAHAAIEDTIVALLTLDSS